MKDIIYELVVDTWRLAARYQFKKLEDSEWAEFIKNGERLHGKYRKKGEAVERLYRDLFDAFQTFYQQISK